VEPLDEGPIGRGERIAVLHLGMIEQQQQVPPAAVADAKVAPARDVNELRHQLCDKCGGSSTSSSGKATRRPLQRCSTESRKPADAEQDGEHDPADPSAHRYPRWRMVSTACRWRAPQWRGSWPWLGRQTGPGVLSGGGGPSLVVEFPRGVGLICPTRYWQVIDTSSIVAPPQPPVRLRNISSVDVPVATNVALL